MVWGFGGFGFQDVFEGFRVLAGLRTWGSDFGVLRFSYI